MLGMIVELWQDMMLSTSRVMVLPGINGREAVHVEVEWVSGVQAEVGEGRTRGEDEGAMAGENSRVIDEGEVRWGVMVGGAELVVVGEVGLKIHGELPGGTGDGVQLLELLQARGWDLVSERPGWVLMLFSSHHDFSYSITSMILPSC